MTPIFPEVIRFELSLSSTKKVVCSLSLGYPKADSNLNLFLTPREPISDMVKFY
ncbi:hypothetical protein AB3N59_19465 [Leptospira sp. WS92.C1]